MPEENNKKCSRCGKDFRCGVTAGEQTCWCFELPRVKVPEDLPKGECLCPFCLKLFASAGTKDLLS